MISPWLKRFAESALEFGNRIGWLPPLLIRLFVGYFFFETGWAKAHDLDGFAQRFAQWGIPYPAFQCRPERVYRIESAARSHHGARHANGFDPDDSST